MSENLVDNWKNLIPFVGSDIHISYGIMIGDGLEFTADLEVNEGIFTVQSNQPNSQYTGHFSSLGYYYVDCFPAFNVTLDDVIEFSNNGVRSGGTAPSISTTYTGYPILLKVGNAPNNECIFKPKSFNTSISGSSFEFFKVPYRLLIIRLS